MRRCLNCRTVTYGHSHLCMDCLRASVCSAVGGAIVAELVRLAFRWLA